MPENLPHPAPVLGAQPAQDQAYLELGSFIFMFQSFLQVHRAGKSVGGISTLQGFKSPSSSSLPSPAPCARAGVMESSHKMDS